MDRQSHWIKENKQERMPPRMIAYDTESRSQRTGKLETQTWRIGCAIRWRTDLSTGDHAEGKIFTAPEDMWAWFADFCRPQTRTVVWAHNLSHDLRIAQALTILPKLGFTLEWCNLDRNVSAMTWRSERGTLILADTWTWLPLSLKAIAPGVNLVKFPAPPQGASDETWDMYCMRDAQIVYRVVSDLTGYIKRNHLGNWQPTGAGMAYATWRHKFMTHKVLVHDDTGALEAERAAMHTGRAEAWRHGVIMGQKWTEVDLRNAYLTIAAECDLPRKLRFRTGAINEHQYRRLVCRNRILCKCDVRTDVPVVPYHQDGRQIWPVGRFTTWLWDTEVDCAQRYGADVRIRAAYVYARGPVLREWALWVHGILRDESEDRNTVVQAWIKHTSRALIGRIALSTRSWELYGSNPHGITGITTMRDTSAGETFRLMHVGDLTFRETPKSESRDSVPMVTSWIMAECRVRLWDAMNAAGLDHIAHVDTDSMLVDTAGLAGLRAALGDDYSRYWQVKGTWTRLEVYGPRNYHRGRQRVVAGVPAAAEEAGSGRYTGERWASAALDLQARGDGVVTTWHDTWEVKRHDPRRADAAGATGRTVSYAVGAESLSNRSSSPNDGTGEYGTSAIEKRRPGRSLPSPSSGTFASRDFAASALFAWCAILTIVAYERASACSLKTAIGH